MAIIDPNMFGKSATGFSGLPVVKQIGLLVAFAGTIALGVSVAIWMRDPMYRPIYSKLSPKEVGDVIDMLQQSNIKYKYDEAYGSISVPSTQVSQARIKLASEGLPKGEGFGFEVLGNKSSFGDSQFIETARYRQALAGELARTISNFQQVKSARVHLAIPKTSSFIRDRKRPSASVFVDLFTGATLKPNTVNAIVQLVSSSVPGLKNKDVSVVDDQGQLLTDNEEDENAVVANKILRYKHQVEKAYADKIQEILLPILGPNKSRARVSADIDYTASEQTQERYNPDMPALRSESMLIESKGPGMGKAGGIPGSLSNQPPGTVSLEASGGSIKIDDKRGGGSSNGNTVNQSTRNFEVDKTISHIMHHPGQVRRLTVAVVVDDKMNVSKSGKVTRSQLEPQEIERIKNLVKNTIGFTPERGDSVEVINAAFAQPIPLEAVPPLPVWKQGWFWDLMKHVLGSVFILLILFGVILPIMKSLASKASSESSVLEGFEEEIIDESGPEMRRYSDPMRLPDNMQTPEARMHVAHELASDDPKRVAQVVKNWVDGGS